jgi:hypothetical protein
LAGELGNCLEDKDTRVRLSAVDAICECANSNPELLSVEEGKVSLTAMGAMCIDVLKKVADCLQDKEVKQNFECFPLVSLMIFLFVALTKCILTDIH